MERFKIEWIKEETGKLNEILVFDNNRPDTEDDPKLFAIYHQDGIYNVGQRKYKTLNQWKKVVEDCLCININWKELEKVGSLSF